MSFSAPGLAPDVDSCCSCPPCWSPLPGSMVLLSLTTAVLWYLLMCLTVSLECKVIENRDYIMCAYLALVAVTDPQWELNTHQLGQMLGES